MHPAEFWRATPYEVYAWLDATVWRNQRDSDRMIAQAWYIEALHRTRRLPSLKVLLESGPAQPVTGEELVAHKRELKRIGEVVKRFEQNR